MKKTENKNGKATGTATGTVAKVEAKVSTKLVEAIRVQLDAFATAEGKMLTTADTTRSEAARLGYDTDTARAMLTLSWREASGFKGNEDAAKAFDLANRPTVSKVMLLAFPPADTAKEVAKVRAFNEKNSAKNVRVGVNRLLVVARGGQKADEAIARKPIERIVKDAPVSKLPIADQFGNAIAALRKQFCSGEKGSLSLAKAREIALEILADAPAAKAA